MRQSRRNTRTTGDHGARDVRQARVPRTAQAGGRRSRFRQSRHHRAAAHGCVRNRERDPLRAGPAGSRRHGDGGWLRPGIRKTHGVQLPHHARPGQRHGHALRRPEGGRADPGHRRPARADLQRHRADPDGGPAADRSAAGEVVDRGASPRRPAAHRASRRQDRAGAADRTGVPLAAGRHPARRRRSRPDGTDAYCPAYSR